MKIAICEDKQQDYDTLLSMIINFLDEHNMKADISSFTCGEDFINAHIHNSYDIVFMDIYLPGINGIETIAKIREKDPVQFVFTTTSNEYAIEAFNLNAAHYILKPITPNAISEAMARCLSRKGNKYSEQLDIKTNCGVVSIPIENIVYIEVLNKICCIYTEKSCYQTYSSLNEMFEMLSDNIFMKAQRSFIVNMNFIELFYFDHIVLANGKDIVLSRSNRTELKNQYQQFLFRLARRGEI